MVEYWNETDIDDGRCSPRRMEWKIQPRKSCKEDWRNVLSRWTSSTPSHHSITEKREYCMYRPGAARIRTFPGAWCHPLTLLPKLYFIYKSTHIFIAWVCCHFHFVYNKRKSNFYNGFLYFWIFNNIHILIGFFPITYSREMWVRANDTAKRNDNKNMRDENERARVQKIFLLDKNAYFASF